MPRRLLAALLAAPIVVVAACGGDNNGARTSNAGTTTAGAAQSDVQTIDVTLSDSGCEPRSIAAKAGPTTFKVKNDGTAAVTEFEVLSGSKILGEVENVIPGSDRSFSLTLAAGSYTTYCPGGSNFEKGTLEVAGTPTGATGDQTARNGAVTTYLNYVKSETGLLVTAVGPFAAAVKSGDIAGAKAQFAAARYHYETIEPIAESFGDLDPAIDAREGDVPETQWGGFHRIEKALWVDNDVSAMGPVADRLVADVGKLQAQVGTIQLEPAQIANGAVELLNEVSTSKITGEEDRYSHTDLSDIAGNLAGAKAAFEALKPLVSGADATVGEEIAKRFDDVQAALDRHKGTDPAGNGYALYDTLTPDQTRALSTSVDTLAEPLSKLAAIVL